MALRTTAARKTTRHLPDQPITCYQQHIPCQDGVTFQRDVWWSRKKLAAPAAPLTQPHQADKKSIQPRHPPTSPRHRSSPPHKKSSLQPTTIKTFTTHRHRHRCRRPHNRRPRRQQLLLHGQSRINGSTRLRGPRQPHRHPVDPTSKTIVYCDHGHTRHPIHRR